LFAAGLQSAVDLIEPIKQRHPSVSYADLYQMASAVAVEVRTVGHGRGGAVREGGALLPIPCLYMFVPLSDTACGLLVVVLN
jgi:hypothetical protein